MGALPNLHSPVHERDHPASMFLKEFQRFHNLGFCVTNFDPQQAATAITPSGLVVSISLERAMQLRGSSRGSATTLASCTKSGRPFGCLRGKLHNTACT